MAAPRRTTAVLTGICLTTLAATEYAVITFAVLPAPSTRFDWGVATGCFPPLSAAFLLGLGAVLARIVADILELIHRTRQWITKNHPQQRHHDPVIRSSSTASDAFTSSSCGWPSPGSPHASHPGREGDPWSEANLNESSTR